MVNKLTVAIAAALFVAPFIASQDAHAINARYRDQLIRSGCTQVSVSEGCDIHKTKAQNEAAAKHPGKLDFSRFAGTYSTFLGNGQRIGNNAIHITRKEIRYNGHAVERPRIINGVLLFNVAEAQFSITNTGATPGSWYNDADNSGGYIGR